MYTKFKSALADDFFYPVLRYYIQFTVNLVISLEKKRSTMLLRLTRKN
jgi:hypothetical protein